ncbi:MAG: CAP domain-containing protein [Chloroflexota bacterium]|nr:CAP domain-containing protein [Chloroflexota bacterium]
MKFRSLSRALASVVLGAFLVTAVGGGRIAAAPANSDAAAPMLANTATGYAPSSQECAFLTIINSYRQSKGIAALKMTRILGASAEHHSVDMAKSGVFSHTLSTGVTWSQNMTNHGYTFSTYRGENIAAGYSLAQDTFNQWKNSPTHNANMLNGNFKAIGIGQVYNSTSKWKYYWTTNFGGYVDSTMVSC